MKTVIIEDDDFSFKATKFAFSKAGISTDIIRARSKICALDLIKDVQEDTLWIVDGNFPEHLDWTPKELWAIVAGEIRTARWYEELIIWYSSEPKIFHENTADVNYVFEKPNPQKLIEKIKEIQEQFSFVN